MLKKLLVSFILSSFLSSCYTKNIFYDPKSISSFYGINCPEQNTVIKIVRKPLFFNNNSIIFLYQNIINDNGAFYNQNTIYKKDLESKKLEVFYSFKEPIKEISPKYIYPQDFAIKVLDDEKVAFIFNDKLTIIKKDQKIIEFDINDLIEKLSSDITNFSLGADLISLISDGKHIVIDNKIINLETLEIKKIDLNNKNLNDIEKNIGRDLIGIQIPYSNFFYFSLEDKDNTFYVAELDINKAKFINHKVSNFDIQSIWGIKDNKLLIQSYSFRNEDVIDNLYLYSIDTKEKTKLNFIKKDPEYFYISYFVNRDLNKILYLDQYTNNIELLDIFGKKLETIINIDELPKGDKIKYKECITSNF
ncbi:MAG: hypothetical protein ACK4IX_00140 [Candidatus Sericytochromatia bacterium]